MKQIEKGSPKKYIWFNIKKKRSLKIEEPQPKRVQKSKIELKQIEFREKCIISRKTNNIAYVIYMLYAETIVRLKRLGIATTNEKKKNKEKPNELKKFTNTVQNNCVLSIPWMLLLLCIVHSAQY